MSAQALPLEISPREYHPVKPLNPEEDFRIQQCLKDEGNLPQHIAIIMDGDRRWAVERNLPKTEGHRFGRESVRDIVRACGQLQIEALTLYTFSTENWSRPEAEVEELMQWLHEALRDEVSELHENNVSLNAIGRTDALSPIIQLALEHALAQTKGQHRPQAQLGTQLRGPQRVSRRLPQAGRRSGGWPARPRRHRRGTNQRSPLYSRLARPGFVNPHQWRNATEQLPPLADGLY